MNKGQNNQKSGISAGDLQFSSLHGLIVTVPARVIMSIFVQFMLFFIHVSTPLYRDTRPDPVEDGNAC
jgi:hypothetical protein